MVSQEPTGDCRSALLLVTLNGFATFSPRHQRRFHNAHLLIYQIYPGLSKLFAELFFGFTRCRLFPSGCLKLPGFATAVPTALPLATRPKRTTLLSATDTGYQTIGPRASRSGHVSVEVLWK